MTNTSLSTTVHVTDLKAWQILDSRGYPTVAVSLRLDDGRRMEASAPAGASTGENEAQELRDHGKEFDGRGVQRALAVLREKIAAAIIDKPFDSIQELDATLASLDRASSYEHIGANSVVAVSMAGARALAHRAQQSLVTWISTQLGTTPLMPVPHFNVVNGGAHASNGLAFQEFMIAPVGAQDMCEAVDAGAEVYHALGKRLREEFGSVGVGDEGGFAPPVDDETQVLDLLLESIDLAGFPTDGSYFQIALDPAANGFYDDGRYRLRGRWLASKELAARYAQLVDSYPIRSIEDGFSERDIRGWQMLHIDLGQRIQIVGDDLYVTDAERIRRGYATGCSNAALIKPNQIGTVSQTFDAIRAAYRSNMRCMISHRSGETLDTFIADLAVGAGTGQIKSGAPARGERVAKYNRLTEIAAETGLRYGLE